MDAAMNSAVSALQAQQAALSTVSDNLANSQTSGYKSVTTQFNSLLTQQATGLGYPAGGVSATARQNLLGQGLVQSTNTTTDMAITGNGMFAVSAGLAGGQDFYTRNGAFDTDSKGNLQLSGTNYYLLGWATDAKGNVLGANPDNIASLQNVNINKFNNSATATTLYSLQANLPAEGQSDAYTQTYISNTTPPTTQNLSFGLSKLSTSSNGNIVYNLTVTGSDPAANITDNASPSNSSNPSGVSGAGKPLVYQVTVDSSGNIIQTVDPAGNLLSGTDTSPVALPTFSITGGQGFSAITSSDNGFATNGSAGPIELTSTLAGLGSPFSQSTSISVYDSLGVAQSFPVTWTAEGNNQWMMTVSNPTNPSGTTQTGQLYDTAGNPVTSYSYNVSFNSDGTLNSVVGLPTTASIAASTFAATGSVTLPTTAGTAPTNGNEPVLSATWFDGAQSSLSGTNAQINIGLGTGGALGTGKTDGLSQFDTGQTGTPSIAVKSTTQNGVQYGNLTGVSIDGSTGNVIAAYSNGQKVPIYKIPVVTFPNENGLAAQNNGVYQQSNLSGSYTLNASGNNGAGTIQGQALEQSNVNTSAEFSNMITAQQAYSAASQVIGTDKQMFTSLIQVVQ